MILQRNRQYTPSTVVEHVQTMREIQGALTAAGLKPRRRFGQHFLIDGNLMRRLADSAELQPNDCVLEVGPGTGGLTDLLVPRAARVIAIEIDQSLHAILSDRFRDAANVTLLQGDVLDGKHDLARCVVEALSAETGEVKLVANLPYQVATPLVLNLLLDFPRVRTMCFTVQAEVADRINAQPGGRDYGPLGILCQALCTIAVIARIGPRCFWPPPHVDSMMLRLDLLERPLVPREELRPFADFVRSVFEHRRKQLRTALAYVTERVDPFDEVGVDLARRPEQLTIHEWLGLFRALPKESEPGAEATGQASAGVQGSEIRGVDRRME